MKHTVTVTHVVDAPTWDLAVEAIMREPFTHVIDCRVKSPGIRQPIYVTVSIMKEALKRLSGAVTA